MLLSLVSCGKLSGTYESAVLGTGSKITFSGSKVTITAIVLGQDVASIEGKYKVKGDEITFDYSDKEENEDLNKILETLNGTLSFEKGDDYIKIGAVKYTKKDQ